MSESAGKIIQRYVENSNGDSRTCFTNGPIHSSDECKVLGDFGYKYVKIIPTKDHGHDLVPRNKFNKHQENNTIRISAVDEILLNENQKVSAAKESAENIESDFDDKEHYNIDNMRLKNTKEKH